MDMKNWLLLCGGYWLLFWVGRQRKAAKTLLCLWDGFYLGVFSFAVLPFAMETPYFYVAACSSFLGVLFGFALEKRGCDQLLRLVMTGVITAYGFYHALPVGRSALWFAFLGGMGLYTTAADLLPEEAVWEERILPSFLGAGGFLISAICFAGF